jgi:hypothetical protein
MVLALIGYIVQGSVVAIFATLGASLKRPSQLPSMQMVALVDQLLKPGRASRPSVMQNCFSDLQSLVDPEPAQASEF